MARKKQWRPAVAEILSVLARCYPDARCALNFSNPFELLIATMLSAQSTDKRVNLITARLFRRYAGPADVLRLSQAELEAEIRDVGLFRSKARAILATCRLLLDKHGGQVPTSRADLEALPGVGRKTANVVLSNAFGVPAIAVDTHVFRVANRIGLADAKNPWETEQQLMARIPAAMWSDAHHRLIHHGRAVCGARNPRCEVCELQPYCRFAAAAAGPRK